MHPESIYIDPQDGLLYFVEGATIGSDFGFPRLGIRKRFKWKKMNFTTDLPKKDPLVSYIVASAVKCEKFFPGSNNDGPVYRMHAVILKKRCAALQLPPLDAKTSKNDSQQSQENDNAQVSFLSSNLNLKFEFWFNRMQIRNSNLVLCMAEFWRNLARWRRPLAEIQVQQELQESRTLQARLDRPRRRTIFYATSAEWWPKNKMTTAVTTEQQ